MTQVISTANPLNLRNRAAAQDFQHSLCNCFPDTSQRLTFLAYYYISVALSSLEINIRIKTMKLSTCAQKNVKQKQCAIQHLPHLTLHFVIFSI